MLEKSFIFANKSLMNIKGLKLNKYLLRKSFCQIVKNDENVIESYKDNKNQDKIKKVTWKFNLKNSLNPAKNELIINQDSNEIQNLNKKNENISDFTSSEKNLASQTSQPPINFKQHFLAFSYENSANYNEATKSKGDGLFLDTTLKLVHYLDDRNINDFKKGISENNYEFYDAYKDIPEFLFLGRSNVGKSSLINALFSEDVAKENKKPGKTQRLEFYLFGKEGKVKNRLPGKTIYSKLKTERIAPDGFLIDAPGFGYVDGPVVLRRKFKYLIYTYLNFAVRLKQIVYLINGEYGMTEIDKEELKFLNNFNKEIQLVFTKVDNFSDKFLIKYITEASHFSRDLKNVRTEILLTSSKTEYGIRNMRTHMFMDIKENEIIKKQKQKEIDEAADLERLKILDQKKSGQISNISNIHINNIEGFQSGLDINSESKLFDYNELGNESQNIEKLDVKK